MAKNQLVRLIENLDRIGSSLVVSGPSRVAKRTIKELQQEGPSWTGRFSNSWQIETPDGRVYKGDGQKGEPRPIKLPVGLLTGQQNIKGSLPLKDRAVTTISNFSPWAGEAVDFVDSKFWRSTPEPETQLGKRKWEQSGRKRPTERHKRYDIYSETGSGNASRTADQDWFTTYATSKLDRAVTLEMDNMFKSFPRR